MKNNIELSKTYWASVSGGKDSLYMLAHILHNLDRYPLDGVVHFELEIDFPFIKNVIDYMEWECKAHNIPFIRIKPSTSYWELYGRYGFPTRVCKWCNHRYKRDAQKQFDDMMKRQNKRVIYYIGLCANEESRVKRREYPNSIFPLYEMGVYEESIWKWAKYQPIFNDYYKYNKRCGCMYCPMTSINSMKYLSVYYNNEYNKLCEMAETKEKELLNRYDRNISVWASNPKYNTAYRRQRIEQIELKEIERW